jgi:putative ABC transport system permease protein
MAWTDRLVNLVRYRHLNAEIDEELQFHIDSRIKDNIAAGMSPAEARRDALRRFGSPAGTRDDMRDANIITALDAISQDVRFAARSLRRRPAFTGIASLTLALGIGANTAIFTVVRSVLLRPLPFSQPDRLQMITVGSRAGMSDRDYVAFREQDRAFEATATYANAPLTLTGVGDAVRVAAVPVTPDFFRVLHVNAVAGRTFVANDARQGAERVVILSHRLWRDRFSADPTLVNRSITLDGSPHVVIGIAPADFVYPAGAEVWTPLEVKSDPGLTFTRPVIGRLADGTTRDQAQAALDMFARTRPGEPSNSIPRVTPLKDEMVGNVETPLLIFSGAVGFVLLIACANVANLVLMRAVSRRHEIATRLALGAGRARLIRLFVTEGALLSLGGGLLGMALAALAGPTLLALVPVGRLPRQGEIAMDGLVIVFTLGLVALTTMAIGLVPAASAGRQDLAAISREISASSTRSSHRLRHALVIAEVALALVLLVGASLLIRSFWRVYTIDPGFNARKLMTMIVDVPSSTYPTTATLHEFHARVLSSLAGIPGVRSAGAVNWLPFGRMHLRGDIRVEDGQVPDGYLVTKAAVSPQYFTTMGIRLIGRDFTDRDAPGAPGVAIVSDAVARRIWPNQNPIGKRISTQSRPRPEDWLTIVGVAGDVRQESLRQPVVPAVYRPYRQLAQAGFLSHMTFVVRSDGDSRELAPAMRAALQGVDRNQAPQSLASMQTVVGGTIAEPRFQSQILAAFSLLALVLAGIGIYGVLAASVVERQREIGIRMALGADRQTVVRMVLRRTLIFGATGIVIGLIGAAWLTKVLAGLLIDITPTDPVAFATASCVVGVAAFLAALLPARRATRVDPLIALRSL